ncbi:MAG TPA: hypothetical protein VD905_10170 [Flavobacteriales bacterium]|nr:hypothetical protein [Flavobacteriales bacterium]
MDFTTMHSQRKFILIAAAVGAISMFLPWFSIFSIHVNGMHNEGILAFFGFVAAIVFSLMGDQKTEMETRFWMISFLSAALACLIIVISFLRMLGAGFGYMGFGLWIAVAASIFLVYCTLTKKRAGDTLQKGFDALFKQGNKQA